MNARTSASPRPLGGALALVLAVAAAAAAADPGEADWNHKQIQLIAGIRPSVVRILSEEAPMPPNFPWEAFGIEPARVPAPHRNVGSGFLIDGRHVLTTADVAGNRAIEVWTHDGRRFAATSLGEDEVGNVAILELEGDCGLPGASWDSAEGGPADLREGAWVALLGYSFGGLPCLQVGAASGPPRRGIVVGDGRQYFMVGFAVPPGAAGGPVIDASGRVVGVAAGMVSGPPQAAAGMFSPGLSAQMGVALAVPIERARRAARALLRGEAIAYGWLGVTVRLEESGLRVMEVTEGSPAELAGLTQGDEICLLDGRPLRNAEELVGQIQEAPVGSRVRLQVHRGDQPVDLEMVVGERPAEWSRNGSTLREILRRAQELGRPTERPAAQTAGEARRAELQQRIQRLSEELDQLRRELARFVDGQTN